MAKKRRRLHDLVVDEVSLVGKGANGKRFIFRKADTELDPACAEGFTLTAIDGQPVDGPTRPYSEPDSIEGTPQELADAVVAEAVAMLEADG